MFQTIQRLGAATCLFLKIPCNVLKEQQYYGMQPNLLQKHFRPWELRGLRIAFFSLLMVGVLLAIGTLFKVMQYESLASLIGQGSQWTIFGSLIFSIAIITVNFFWQGWVLLNDTFSGHLKASEQFRRQWTIVIVPSCIGGLVLLIGLFEASIAKTLL